MSHVFRPGQKYN